MGKNVYSLVLSDDIIRAADALACRLGMSRSALIDEILAEHLSVQTPQVQMKNILDSISRFFGDDMFRLQTATGSSGMLIKSPLPFKYKPTIRYSVELSCDGKYLGRLKVNFRTQNARLSEEMGRFISLLAKLETRYLSPYTDIYIEADNDKMTRMLAMPKTVDGEIVRDADSAAAAIADYIGFLDKIIKLYFSHLSERNTAVRYIDSEYANRMKSLNIII